MLNIINHQFGSWLVTERVSTYSKGQWIAHCLVCKTSRILQHKQLKAYHTLVCACHKNKRRTTHGCCIGQRSTIEYILYCSAKTRAHKLGLPFSINLIDIVIPAFCPLLGIPIVRRTGHKCPADDSPTLNRIIPDKGYVPGNVMVISKRASTIKNDATPNELKKIAEELLPYYNGALQS